MSARGHGVNLIGLAFAAAAVVCGFISHEAAIVLVGGIGFGLNAGSVISR